MDLQPEMPPEEAQGQDDLGQGEPLLAALPAQLLPVGLDLLLGRLLGDPFAELAVNPVGPAEQLLLVEFLVGGKADVPLDVLEIAPGQLFGAALDEVHELLGYGGLVQGRRADRILHPDLLASFINLTSGGGPVNRRRRFLSRRSENKTDSGRSIH